MVEDQVRAVIIDPAFLGDTVFDGPLVRALKHRHPSGTVGLVVRPPADRVARRIRGVDRVHVFDKRGRDRGLGGLWRMARELRGEAYTLAYIPHPSLRSVLLAVWAGIPRRIGGPQGFFGRLGLTEHRGAWTGSFVEDRLALLGQGSQPDEMKSISGVIDGPAGDPPAGPARIGLCLGSEWATKRWPIERAAEWCRSLDPTRHRLVLLGAPWEAPLYQALRRAAPEALVSAEDRTGGSLDDLLDALPTCQVVVGGDTGPLHIARAMGIPVVALFGPTSDRLHRFRAEDQVLTVELPCRPCSAHGGKRCPLGHHRCLAELSGDRVHGAVTRILGPSPGAKGPS